MTTFELKNGEFYTKHYPDGEKSIFQFNKITNPTDDMISVKHWCIVDDENSHDPESYMEDDEIYVGTDGTSTGATVLPATEEEINKLKGYINGSN